MGVQMDVILLPNLTPEQVSEVAERRDAGELTGYDAVVELLRSDAPLFVRMVADELAATKPELDGAPPIDEVRQFLDSILRFALSADDTKVRRSNYATVLVHSGMLKWDGAAGRLITGQAAREMGQAIVERGDEGYAWAYDQFAAKYLSSATFAHLPFAVDLALLWAWEQFSAAASKIEIRSSELYLQTMTHAGTLAGLPLEYNAKLIGSSPNEDFFIASGLMDLSSGQKTTLGQDLAARALLESNVPASLLEWNFR
ncbi:hypothetical protein GCM10009631_22760 [Corynebacterium glaucum]